MTEHYASDGPYLIRLIDFQNGILDLKDSVRVARHKYDEQPQIHLRAGDVLLVKDGNGIGTACIVPEVSDELCAGSTLARVRVLGEIEPHYLGTILNHEIVQIQIRSIATGLAQPHITQEWMTRLQIPIVSRHEEVAKNIQKHHACLMRANALTKRAANDIDLMIEGKLDESVCIEEGRRLAAEFGLERP